MAERGIEVPMQPYAGALLLIKDLTIPDTSSSTSKARPSFFDRSCVLKRLLRVLGQECPDEEFNIECDDPLIEGFMAGLETFMKFTVQKSIEQCEHRTSYFLYNDKRCIMLNEMRPTMNFLNDLKKAQCGSAEEDDDFHRRDRKRDSRGEKIPSMKMDAINTTALNAIGRKPPVAGQGAQPPVAQPPGSLQRMRNKNVNVHDVMQFMAEEKRFSRSNMLFLAYLKYK
ncbi:transcription initiation factor TFIID subunit 4-like [Drosophila bipectinata]|uniref:transcription initiation factor TFIID subunit 4-like n=1 Tax=Drosophila bipectinata TaxID=42026 RepID=UPI001C896649|nr:uncharacterized protein LOC108124033 [Drosophila bipectinata]